VSGISPGAVEQPDRPATSAALAIVAVGERALPVHTRL